jgi:hypothetical protein
MATYYYSMLGMVRVREVPPKWIVEISYKDEDIHFGQYKTEHIWHHAGEFSNFSEVGEFVLGIVKEETKREIQPNHPDTTDIG